MSECKLMKCGHCETVLVDDQCGKPEHRYCVACSEGECSSSIGKQYNDLMMRNLEISQKLDSMQVLYDEYKRTAEREITQLEASRSSLSVSMFKLQESHLENMRHLVQRTRERDSANLQVREMGEHAARLRVCLIRYGQHTEECWGQQSMTDKTCRCGLEANIQAVPGDTVNRVESNDFGRYPCCNGANGYHALSCRPPQVAEKRSCVCGCHAGGDGSNTACGCCLYPNQNPLR